MTDYLPLLTLGILPSLIWLFYFLEKDNDPEPRLMIFMVFSLGVGGAYIASLIQYPLRNFLYSLNPFLLNEFQLALIAFFDAFFAIAFLEEFVKMGAVLIIFSIFGVKNLDEPVDFIIYMITAGLGFAAMENYFYFSRAPLEIIRELVFLRFAITTLFHALSAGILGYFLALAIRKAKIILVPIGLLVATFFHTLYNLLIERMNTSQELHYPILLLAFLFFLSLALLKGFTQTKKMKSVCDVDL